MTRPALLCAAAVLLAAAFLAADRIERSLLTNTATLVLLVEAIALPIAGLLAFLLARTNAPGTALALLLCSSLLFVPLYLQLCGWDAAFGRQGWFTYAINQLQHPWLLQQDGWNGVVAIHVAWSIPWATCLMAAAFAQGDPEQEEDALLDGSPGEVFRRVTFPQLLGGVLLAALWVFVITAGEMTVTNIYMVQTYTEDVYNFYVGNGESKANLVHYFPLLLFTLALIVALLAALPSPALLQSRAAYRWKLGPWRPVAAVVVVLLPLSLALFPFANLVQRLGEQTVSGKDGQPLRTWSAAHAVDVLAKTPARISSVARTGRLDARPDAAENSVMLSISATILALALALSCSWLARRRRWLSSGGWIGSAVGLALPGPIIGLGVIALLNHDLPPLDYLYDRTLAGPILAVTVRVAPLMFAALWIGLRTIDEEPLDAAALDGAGPLRRLFSIALPQRWPLFGAAILASLAIASGDVSASLLVLPPGFGETIARRMFGWIHVGADDLLAGVAILCWLVYVVIATGVHLLFRRTKVQMLHR